MLNQNKKKTLIIIAGGSGTGKTTIENLLAQDPNISKIISTTTRPKRKGEIEEKDYHFISPEKFQAELKQGKFVEHVIYDGNYYGAERKAIDLVLEIQKKNGVIVVSVEGFRQIKKYCQEKGYNTISFWFQAESLEKMVKRMQKRGTPKTEIIHRLIIAQHQSQAASEFDYILTIKENGLSEASQKIKAKLNYG